MTSGVNYSSHVDGPSEITPHAPLSDKGSRRDNSAAKRKKRDRKKPPTTGEHPAVDSPVPGDLPRKGDSDHEVDYYA